MSGTTLSRHDPAARYVSTNLESVLDKQGRKRRWLADQVDVSESLISKILAGERTVDRALGESISTVLGVPFFVLFELHEGDVIIPLMGRSPGEGKTND